VERPLRAFIWMVLAAGTPAWPSGWVHLGVLGAGTALHGYEDYARRVRARLLPGLW
jgi:hypothetical protein